MGYNPFLVFLLITTCVHVFLSPELCAAFRAETISEIIYSFIYLLIYLPQIFIDCPLHVRNCNREKQKQPHENTCQVLTWPVMASSYLYCSIYRRMKHIVEVLEMLT